MIIDLHTHLDTLDGFVQFRSHLQKHKISIADHIQYPEKLILNVAFYAQFYQSFDHLLKMINKQIKIINSNEQFKVIKNKEDLNSNYKIGFIFHLESARLITKPEIQIPELYNLGIRGIIPLHFIDNNYGNSCDDFVRRLRIKSHDAGLTGPGRDLIALCNKLGMWVDISHATDKTAQDILKSAQYVLASHTGIREFKNYKRNIPLEHAKEILNKQGLIGLIPWSHLIPSNKNGYRDLIEFCLNNGLEKSLCIGSDFGAPIKTHKDDNSIFSLAGTIENNFNRTSDCIKFQNAMRFYSRLFQ